MSEFNLIDLFFKSLPEQYPRMQRQDVALGIGDDCALLNIPANKQLAVSTDTLIEGVHFPRSTSAYDIGYKSLAVNLSDLAAMGAEPAWVSLAITLPEKNHDWLRRFTQGFAGLASQYQIQLIGGDTTSGPLSITVQIFGWLKTGLALCRHQAKEGDDIYISGTLGDAGLGLVKALKPESESLDFCLQRLNRPSPRIDLGLALSGISQCAIDISDGLLSDLQHITQQSQLGAVIELEKLPLSNELKNYYQQNINWSQIINSGDDYELCFTARQSQQEKIIALQEQLNLPLTKIGKMIEGSGIACFDQNNQSMDIKVAGYNHFKESI